MNDLQATPDLYHAVEIDSSNLSFQNRRLLQKRENLGAQKKSLDDIQVRVLNRALLQETYVDATQASRSPRVSLSGGCRNQSASSLNKALTTRPPNS